MQIKDFCLSWGMLLLGVILNVSGIYIAKMKINTFGTVQFNSFENVMSYLLMLIKSPLIIVGLSLFLIACIPYAIALSKMELSVAYPVSVALNCLILVPLTIIFLGEGVTWTRMAGMGMLVVSLYLMYR